jgi:signal transduction histidine kinase
MNVPDRAPGNDPEPAVTLEAGVLALGPEGTVRFADERALDLLGCADGFELDRVWSEVRPRLEAAGLRWQGAGGGAGQAALELPVAENTDNEAAPAADPAAAASRAAARRLLFDLRRGPEGGGVLLVRDAVVQDSLAADLRLAAQMRSLSQISPAVAHDLRAPINAMVFNLEILKETIASGRGSEPGGTDRQLRYVNVLKEELLRLHKSLEIFLAHTSPRGDRAETLDLREVVQELAALLVAPARKQQVQVQAELPPQALSLVANRYLLRQALLHLALAALTGVPKQGLLTVRLEGEDNRARLRLAGNPGPDSPAVNSADAATSESEVPGFEPRPTPAGTLAQLWVARSILAAHGGEARAAGPAFPSAGGAPQVYEVELPVLGNSSSANQE